MPGAEERFRATKLDALPGRRADRPALREAAAQPVPGGSAWRRRRAPLGSVSSSRPFCTRSCATSQWSEGGVPRQPHRHTSATDEVRASHSPRRRQVLGSRQSTSSGATNRSDSAPRALPREGSVVDRAFTPSNRHPYREVDGDQEQLALAVEVAAAPSARVHVSDQKVLPALPLAYSLLVITPGAASTPTVWCSWRGWPW